MTRGVFNQALRDLTAIPFCLGGAPIEEIERPRLSVAPFLRILEESELVFRFGGPSSEVQILLNLPSFVAILLRFIQTICDLGEWMLRITDYFCYNV